MKATSLFIGVPVYDAPHAAFFESMLRIVGNKKTIHDIQFQPIYNVATVHMARGVLASMFLAETKHEWLLMTDCDMQFAIDDIERLLSRGQKLIGGLYQKRVRTDSPQYVLNPLPGRRFDPTEWEVQEVMEVGTGFMLIHRTVLEAIRDANPGIRYTEDGTGNTRWDFFTTGVYDGRFLTGDWSICRRWRELGGQVFVDCGRKLPHHGKAVY